MTNKRILFIYAHPDDESFGSGPLIAKYAREGAEVSLICTTNGDVGAADEQYLKKHNSVADMRLAELDCASKILGFKEVILFGYRDSGMMGTELNNAPECLWQAPLEVVTARIVEAIRRIHPQVIITFDPYGGYGHPDHIKTHQATVAAFNATRGEPDGPQKLYFDGIGFPKGLLAVAMGIARFMGKDPRKFGRNGDVDVQAVYEHILPTHTSIPIAKYVDIGLQASACHASQGGESQSSGPAAFFFRLLGRSARLTRVYPEPRSGDKREQDVFEGIKL